MYYTFGILRTPKESPSQLVLFKQNDSHAKPKRFRDYRLYEPVVVTVQLRNPGPISPNWQDNFFRRAEKKTNSAKNESWILTFSETVREKKNELMATDPQLDEWWWHAGSADANELDWTSSRYFIDKGEAAATSKF